MQNERNVWTFSYCCFFKVIIIILFHIFYLYLWGFFSLPCSTIIQTVGRIHNYTCLLQFYALISGHPRGEVGVTLGDIDGHGAGFDNFCYQFLSGDAEYLFCTFVTRSLWKGPVGYRTLTKPPPCVVFANSGYELLTVTLKECLNNPTRYRCMGRENCPA